MAGPLTGFRVLDCSEGIAGAKAAMLLGDLGADVARVLPAGDALSRQPGFAVWDRNKRAIEADLLTPQGRDTVHRRISGADIVVLDRPLADLDHMGLSPEALSGSHPGLVALHMPPFTTYGDDAWLPASTELLSAASGISYEQYKYEDKPVDPVFPHLLYIQAMWAAVTAVAALAERERSGFGQVVTVSRMHATVLTMTGTITNHPAMSRGVRPGGGAGPIPFFRLYQCADGEWLIMAALTSAFYMTAFEILGVLDVFADPRLGGEPAAMALPANAGWVIERLSVAFRTKTRDEWLTLFREAGLPAGPVYTREEWFAHDQIVAIGMRHELEDPARGHVAMPGIPLTLSATPPSIRLPAPASASGDVPDWSPRPAPTGTATGAQGPLAGLRVLDLGVVIAGSFGATMLAELGADVVKVEPHGGDSLRAFAPTWLGYNKAKRSAVLDLQTDAGREALYALVRGADIVIDNYRPGVLERLKLDYESLRQLKPDIITVSVTGYGQAGPLRNEPGFDPVLQAASGMMRAQGGDAEPTFITIPVTDTPTALAGILGGLSAYVHRLRTGQGQRVSTSLAAASVFMQSGEIVEFAGKPPSRKGGRDFQGPATLDRFYATQDGWVRLQATGPADRGSLAALGAIGNATEDDAQIERELSAWFAARTSQEAVDQLHWHHIPAVPVSRKFREFAGRESMVAEEASTELELKDGKQIFAAGRYARFSRTQLLGHRVPPGLGEHTREILREAGYDDAAINALVRDGVAAEGKPFTV